MKKLISVVLVLTMIFAVCPMNIANAEIVKRGTCGDNVTWTLDRNGILVISGTGEMTGLSMSVHDKVEIVVIENGVTSICNSAFGGSPYLTNIIIPNSVTSIGDYAFYRCEVLTNITIPNSVTSIGNSAFSDCNALTSITIPDSVTSIGDEAFSDCNALTSITVPDSVTSIGNHAFDNTKYYNDETNWENGVLYAGNHLVEAKPDKIASEYTIRDGTKTILDSAFQNCNNLKSVIIPDSVISIDNDAFLCSGLTGIIIPDSVTSIGSSAFANSISLENIIIPDSVTSMGNHAFDNTKYYNDETNWENGILYIGNHLIYAKPDKNDYKCIIKDGIKTIADSAFGDCSNLKHILYYGIPEDWGKITIGTNNEYLTNAKVHYTQIVYSGTDGSINWNALNGELIISGSESIPDYDEFDAPWYPIQNEITKVTIEGGINTIGTNAFKDFQNVENISIPSSVIQINSGAFSDCPSLKNVTLSPSMTGGIGGGAFKNCTGLTSFEVPSGIAVMEQGVFEGCENLTEITLPFIGSMPGKSNTKDTFSYIFNGNVPQTLKKVTITNETDIPENAFQNCEYIETIIINDGISTVGSGAFDGCKSLKGFNLPKNITVISDNMFRNCEKIAKISLPDTVKEIGMSAFDGCKSMGEMIIPSGITTIENSTFKGCVSLTKIEIPLSVTYIGTNAFRGCNRLVDVKVPFVGANADPALSDTSLKKSFGYLFGVKNENIPPSVTKIEITGTDSTMYIPDNAFNGCGYIEDIIIDGGRSIGNYAFANCKNLRNIYIPKSIKNMGNKILQGCTRIETMVVPFIGINRQDANTETSVIGAFFDWDDENIATGTRQYYDNNQSSHLYQIPPTLKNVSVLNQTNIPAGAFSECSIENVSIISGAVMNDYVFYNCTELKNVSLPSNMTNIGVEAFAECEKLETINIPTKVKEIGDHAFYGAVGLKDVTMPNSITEIAEDIFDSRISMFSADGISLFSYDGCVITCAKDSEAYNYAVKKGIKTNVVSEDKLDKRRTATSVALLSDNSYLFDITDSYSMSGVLHVDLYDDNSNVVKTWEKAVNGTEVEYKAEFSEEDMRGVAFAKIYISDAQGNRISKVDEIISTDGGEIPIIPESDIALVYSDGAVRFEGTTSVKAGSVLIHAIYDGDMLQSVMAYPVSGSSDVIDVNADFTKGSSKFMLWNDLDKMMPLAEAVVE